MTTENVAGEKQQEQRCAGSAARAAPGMRLEAIIAQALGIDEDQVVDDLSYQSVPQWDSLNHVSLMLAFEEAFGIEIGRDLRLRLASVRAIRDFQAERAGAGGGADVAPSSARSPSSQRMPASSRPIQRGLHGVNVDRSRITRIDGEAGTLEYRGYSIHDLATHSSIEETAYLLIHGDLPDAAALAAFRTELVRARSVPGPVLELMSTLRSAHPMDALRTGVSALGAFDPDGADDSAAACLRKGIRLVSQVPILIGAHHAARQGRELRLAASEAPHADWLLELVTGRTPTAVETRIFNRDLIVHADHSSNASTFAARVIAGCRAGMHAAITGAIAAFQGLLHGGAAEQVMSVVDEVGAPARAGEYVSERLSKNQPVMGFGHRVYRTEDPRVRHLRDAALEVSRARGEMNGYEVIAALVEAMKPYARHGVDANVDLYAGLVYRMLDIPDDLAVPIFVAGRIVGWVAQALEQYANNILIRPLLQYVGPTGRVYPTRPLAQ